ncbi:lytic transglycosylase, partial [Rhodococcus sp. IEGM 1351]|nr:lytic transglycosylase [Rhodococcus sp. IEGM 1351]
QPGDHSPLPAPAHRARPTGAAASTAAHPDALPEGVAPPRDRLPPRPTAAPLQVGRPPAAPVGPLPPPSAATRERRAPRSPPAAPT